MPQFRIAAKNLFLTYPQVGNAVTKEALREFFVENKKCADYTIGQESHSDGGIHFHCLIRWNEVYSTTNERHFDIAGCHPNIQTARSPKAIYAYVTKDGDYISNRPEFEKGKADWSEVMKTESEAQYWDLIKKDHPREYCLNLERLEYTARKKFKANVEEYVSPWTSFKITNEMEEWLRDEYPKVISMSSGLRLRGLAPAHADT